MAVRQVYSVRNDPYYVTTEELNEDRYFVPGGPAHDRQIAAGLGQSAVAEDSEESSSESSLSRTQKRRKTKKQSKSKRQNKRQQKARHRVNHKRSASHHHAVKHLHEVERKIPAKKQEVRHHNDRKHKRLPADNKFVDHKRESHYSSHETHYKHDQRRKETQSPTDNSLSKDRRNHFWNGSNNTTPVLKPPGSGSAPPEGVTPIPRLPRPAPPSPSPHRSSAGLMSNLRHNWMSDVQPRDFTTSNHGNMFKYFVQSAPNTPGHVDQSCTRIRVKPPPSYIMVGSVKYLREPKCEYLKRRGRPCTVASDRAGSHAKRSTAKVVDRKHSNSNDVDESSEDESGSVTSSDSGTTTTSS